MKKLLILSLLVVGCNEADLSTDMVGEWQITWAMEEGSRIGYLILNNDLTGEISLEEEPKSLIAPNAETIKVKWVCSNDYLILTRLDNNFVLKYHIKSRNENSIDLSFVDDINILLIRQ